MKLVIKNSKDFEFRLWLPTSLLKSKLVFKSLKKYGVDTQPLKDLPPMIHKSLKEYIKEHGHFALVDIKNSDGTRVLIII